VLDIINSFGVLDDTVARDEFGWKGVVRLEIDPLGEELKVIDAVYIR
jgi:hypothetical protein